jgi:hypothetical protein
MDGRADGAAGGQVPEPHRASPEALASNLRSGLNATPYTPPPAPPVCTGAAAGSMPCCCCSASSVVMAESAWPVGKRGQAPRASRRSNAMRRTSVLACPARACADGVREAVIRNDVRVVNRHQVGLWARLVINSPAHVRGGLGAVTTMLTTVLVSLAAAEDFVQARRGSGRLLMFAKGVSPGIVWEDAGREQRRLGNSRWPMPNGVLS